MTTILEPAATSWLRAPYISGQRYGGRDYRARADYAVTANVLFAMPFNVFQTITIDRLGLYVVTGAAGNAKFGIARDGGGLPVSTFAEGNQDVSTAASGVEIESTFATNPVLTPGQWWYLVCFSGTPTVITPGASVGGGGVFADIGASLGGAIVGAGDAQIRRTAALSYVAGPTPFFPATIGAVTSTGATPASPSMWFRVV